MKALRLLLTLTFLSGSALLAQSDAAAKPDLAQYKTADALWDHVQLLGEGPKEKPKTKEEFFAYLGGLHDAAAEFVKKYPNDTRKWKALMLEAQTESLLARTGQSGFQADKVITVAQQISTAKDAPKELKDEADFILLTAEMKKDPADFKKAMAAYDKAHPNDPKVDKVKFAYAKRLAQQDKEAALAMAKELSTSKDEQVAAAATAMVQASEMIGKPVDLKFTAVDGTEVDLSKMTGKVVLIDFWATWCGPCMSEVPNVVATYNKLHPKGFEIVGISLDESKEALLSVTKESGMTWPQYFDGLGWKNKISTRFGIDSIPRMWLINKKGELVSTEGRRDLEATVEKLLAE